MEKIVYRNDRRGDIDGAVCDTLFKHSKVIVTGE
jgi:hypothetical protein